MSFSLLQPPLSVTHYSSHPVAEDELRRMQDIRNQRLEMLQRRDRETYSAVMWLQDNQNLFKERIFEPVCLLVSGCVGTLVFVFLGGC